MSKLLSINVSDHTEKKNGLTYLSWAWAWAEVLKIDPKATWEAHEFNGLPAAFLPDESAMVKVSVTIEDHTKSCWLPVMDHRNKAIKGPDAFAINTAIVRCLTKCVSMHGLGLYIYAGEDLPEDAPKTSGGSISAPAEFFNALSPEWQAFLKTNLGPRVENAFEGGGPSAALDVINAEEIDSDTMAALWHVLPSKVRSAIDKVTKNRPRDEAWQAAH